VDAAQPDAQSATAPRATAAAVTHTPLDNSEEAADAAETDDTQGLDDSDADDGDDDVHVQSRKDAEVLLAGLVGHQVKLKDNITWTVVDNVLDSTEEPRQAALGTAAGLRGGLPTADGDLDLLALWLKFYPGDMDVDLHRLNSQAALRKTYWKPVCKQEWVTFWGLVIGARQFHVRGKDLWETQAGGLQPAPDFGRFMTFSRFSLIREMVKWSKANVDAQPTDPWCMFWAMTADFNATRATNVNMQLVQVLDESMCNWQPRKDKLGGLPNISYVQRKPRPLGTEWKCICDGDTGLMLYLEVQEGRDPMRKARFSAEQGCTAACTMRLCEAVGDNAQSRTYVADSWFGSVKVIMQLMESFVQREREKFHYIALCDINVYFGLGHHHGGLPRGVGFIHSCSPFFRV
jgi:hypothetical protein